MLFKNDLQIVPIERLNFKFDVRLTGNDLDQIQQMELAIRNGQELPAIIVNQRYEIVEGRQRWEAAKRAGLRELAVIVQNFADSASERIFAVNSQLGLAMPLDQESIRWNVKKLLREEGLTGAEVVKALASKLPEDVIRRYVADALSKMNKEKIQAAMQELGAGVSRARIMAKHGVTEKQIQDAIGYRKKKIGSREKGSRKGAFGTALRTVSRKLEDQRKGVLRDFSEGTLAARDAEEIMLHAYEVIQKLQSRVTDYKQRLYQAIESSTKLATTRSTPLAVMTARAKK